MQQYYAAKKKLYPGRLVNYQGPFGVFEGTGQQLFRTVTLVMVVVIW